MRNRGVFALCASAAFALLPLQAVAQAKILMPITTLDRASPSLKSSSVMKGGPGILLPRFPGLAAVIQPAGLPAEPDKGVTCPTDKAGLTDGFQVFVYQLTNDMAAALSFWAKAELSVSDKVLLYQFAWYKDVLDQDGFVAGRCGAGVMLALRVSNYQGNLTLTLPTLAASAQLNQSQIAYKFGTFGLSGASIDAAIPKATIGKFDTESYAALSQSISAIQSAYTSPAAQFVVTPRPIAVSFAVAVQGFDTRVALQAFSLKQIAAGKSCREARAAVPGRDGSTDDVVEDVYESVTSQGCGLLDRGPTKDVQDKEKAILDKYGVK